MITLCSKKVICRRTRRKDHFAARGRRKELTRVIKLDAQGARNPILAIRHYHSGDIRSCETDDVGLTGDPVVICLARVESARLLNDRTRLTLVL